MLRLACFVVLVLLLRSVLGLVPGVGEFLDRAGIFGIWALAFGLSWFLSRWMERALLVRRDAAKMRVLGAVPSPHNQGKVGAMLLAHGKPKKALEPLRAACAGEPDVAEWHYRLGLAFLALRRHEDAASALERCTAIEEEYAYGAALLRLAQAEVARGETERALAVLERFEKNHGPNPESAYRRGRVLRKLGRAAEARRAFAEVKGLAASAAKYQRREAAMWSLRATLARLV